MRRLVLFSTAFVLVACGDPATMGTPVDLGTGGLTSETANEDSGDDPGTTTDAEPGTGDESSGGSPDPTVDPSDGSSGDSDDPPAALDCAYASTSFGNSMQELDVIGDPDSPIRLRFTVPGLPASELIQSATLRFRGYDLDHPGEEGLIYVNGSAPIQLPADAGWDNQPGTGAVDVVYTSDKGGKLYEPTPEWVQACDPIHPIVSCVYPQCYAPP